MRMQSETVCQKQGGARMCQLSSSSNLVNEKAISKAMAGNSKMEAVLDRSSRDLEESTKSGQHSSTPRFLPHHIKIMKVALALAIIRQRPDGVSSREYTERLALQFSQLQVDWRERALQLQQELLRTRQELARFQIQTETLTQTQTHTTGVGVPWSDTEWQSSGYSSSFQPASQDGDQPMQQQHGEDQNGWRATTNRSDRIAAHVKFLSSVSSALNARHNLSVLAESDLRTAVRDTLIEATRGLSGVLSLSCLPVLPPPLNNLETAIQTIVDAIQAPRMRPFHAELVEACVNLLKSITGRISRHQHTKLEPEVLCSVACTLSSVPALYRLTVQQLTSAVLECAEMLSRSIQDVSMLDVVAVESAAVVFRALEALFTKYDTSTLPEEMCSRLSSELENSVLNLSSTYPLFTYSVWTLLAHLAPANR